MSASGDCVADVVNATVDHADVGESDGAKVDDDVRASQLLLGGDDEIESEMSSHGVRVVDCVHKWRM